jgi:hypothetical protein
MTLHQEIQMKHITVWNLPPGQFNAAVARFLETGGSRRRV